MVLRWIAYVAAGVLALDQLSKFLVVQVLNLRSVGEIDVLPPFLNFRMAWNRGVNFGLFSSDAELVRWGLVAVAVIISGWVAVWMWRDAPRRIAQIAAGFLIGGALGNAIDRIVYGAVADFLNMSCCGFDNPFAFNVADISIFLGAVGLVVFSGPNKTS